MSSPKVQQIADTIRGRIRSGEYRPKERIPSQLTLRKEFGVSESTLAKINRGLRDQGYVWILPSKGTYARPPQDWPDIPLEKPGV